jgi:hypothetical protein
MEAVNITGRKSLKGDVAIVSVDGITTKTSKAKWDEQYGLHLYSHLQTRYLPTLSQ